MIVGGTHWDHETEVTSRDLPGPAPAFFFAPAQITKRNDDWGRDELGRRTATAWTDYSTWTDGWLALRARHRRAGRGRGLRGAAPGGCRPANGIHLLARPRQERSRVTVRVDGEQATTDGSDGRARAPRPQSQRSARCHGRDVLGRRPRPHPRGHRRSCGSLRSLRLPLLRRSGSTATGGNRPAARTGVEPVPHPCDRTRGHSTTASFGSSRIGSTSTSHRRDRPRVTNPCIHGRHPARPGRAHAPRAARVQIEKHFAPELDAAARVSASRARRRARRALRARGARPLPGAPRVLLGHHPSDAHRHAAHPAHALTH